MFVTIDELSALAQVILVDLVLAGDNAIVIGLFAATVPTAMRQRVILIGIVFAAITRIAFALATAKLLLLPGLLLVGGLLLSWVCWHLWRNLRQTSGPDPSVLENPPSTSTSMTRAIIQIVIADLSMSLDNVLAIAGIARHHPVILMIGLALSIALMAAGASLMARLLVNHRWIGYVGLAIILYVAAIMIWDGSREITAFLGIWPY